MDSPLSEPDSLSSPGATTEPLPNSEADDLQLSSSPPPTRRRSRSRSLHGPEPRASTGAGGGAESDSSLTEQSDSEVEPSALDTVEDDDDQMEEAPGGAASELGDDEQEEDDEDEPVQRTPRGNKRPRPIALGEEYEDGVDGELSRPARKRVGSHSASDDELSLSSASCPHGTAAAAKTASPSPTTKRTRPAEDGSVASSSASTVGAPAAPRPAPAVPAADAQLSADSLSELDDDDDEPQAPRPAQKLGAALVGAPASDEEDGDDAPVPSASPKSKKAAPRGRGANGRPRGLGARGRPRAVATKPSAAARSESPLSTVGSSAGEDKVEDTAEADVEMVNALPGGGGLSVAGAGAGEVGDEAAVKELEVEASAVEALAAAAADASATTTARPAAAKGRAKVKGKSKGKAAVKSASEAMRRSTSNESSGDAPKHLGNGTSPSNSAFSALPALPAPSGLVELETAPDAVAHQLAELAEAEADVAADAAAASASGSGSGSAAAPDDSSAPMDGVEAGDSQLTGGDGLDEDRADAVVEEVEEEERPAPPPSAKKGAISKKGSKKGKGKEKAAPAPAEDVHGDEDEAVEGEEEEDTSDDAFMRKRAEAMEALTKIEISFARLRDLLYLERLADVEKERLAIETGAHPELVHLTQLIELRRNRKLELARLWLDGLENAYDIQFTDREHANWNSWQDDRARERTRMLDEANSKRRRLEREKRALERPKDDSLASMLAPRPPPVVPLHHRRRVGFDADPLDDNEIAWSLRHPDVRVDASVRGLDDEATYGDLERMGLREPIRHPLFPYDAVYAHATGLGGPTYGDSRTAHLGYPYGGGGYDGSAHAMPQQHQHPGFASAFSSLPPLPQHQRVESGPPRPPSNPRLAQGFPAELGGGQPGYPAASRAHGNGHYPQTYAEIEAWQQQQQQPRHGGFDDERRRRTLSAGGSLGPPRSHESLDAVAAHRQNGYTPAVSSAAGQDGDPTGGRTTPTHAGAAAKARFTLDEHMSTRSPKGPASVSSVASSASKAPATPAVSVASASTAAAAAAAARSNPPAFMAIPAIPPFDRNRHEQTIRARAAAAATGTNSGGSSPAPPVLPPLKQHPTPTSTPLFPPQQQQQAKQQQAPTQAQGQGSFSAYPVPQRAA
ncbi:hypothetical protein JCM9279_003672 [Rhodotorula babjevae]